MPWPVTHPVLLRVKEVAGCSLYCVAVYGQVNNGGVGMHHHGCHGVCLCNFGHLPPAYLVGMHHHGCHGVCPACPRLLVVAQHIVAHLERSYWYTVAICIGSYRRIGTETVQPTPVSFLNYGKAFSQALLTASVSHHSQNSLLFSVLKFLSPVSPASVTIAELAVSSQV